MVEITRPPAQQNAAATPALRGPDRSTQLPKTAAEEPRKTKNRVNIQPSMEIGQSQVVVNTLAKKLISAWQATGPEMPMALESGRQNTENPYAMPMLRW